MIKRLIASLVCLTFSFTNFQYVHAHDFSVNQLPVPGTMVGESIPFAPLALKGLIVNPQKPLEFQFIVDTGRGPQDTASVKEQANQLVKYFLAGLTIPEGDLWVNLSPYEKNRMVPEALGQTDLGRDLLAQDYILKQLTASLIYPEKDLGKEFWSRVYAKAQQQFGTTNVPVNTFNKVWILPDQAQVYENVNAAYVTKSTLKVMLDEDYLAKQKHQATQASSISSQIVREIVIPEITKEVNTGKNFAPLRQIYQALILAKWYKETIQNGLLDAVYTNKNKVRGVNLADPAVKEQIYERYLKAYKKGAFNYIKEDPTPDGQVVPRKYFSGGFTEMGMKVKRDGAMSAVKRVGILLLVAVGLGAAGLGYNYVTNTPSYLIKELINSDNTVNQDAEHKLENKGESVVPELIEAMKNDPRDEFTVYHPEAMVDIIGHIGGRETALKLINELKNNGDHSYYSQTVVAILAKIVDKTTAPALAEALKNCNRDLIPEVAEILKQKGDKTIVPVLINELEAPDSYVRYYVVKILGEIGDTSAIPGLIQELKDSDNATRFNAVEALGNIGDRGVVPALAQNVKEYPSYSDSVFDARWNLANVLKQLSMPGSSALVNIFDGKDYDGQLLSSFMMLEFTGDKTAIPGIIQILKNSKIDNRRITVWALTKMEDKTIFPAIIETLKDSKQYGILSHFLESQIFPYDEMTDWGLEVSAKDVQKDIDGSFNQPGVMELIKSIDSWSDEDFNRYLPLLLKSQLGNGATWAAQSYSNIVYVLKTAELAKRSDRVKRAIRDGLIVLPKTVYANLEWSHAPSIPIQVPEVYYEGKLLNKDQAMSTQKQGEQKDAAMLSFKLLKLRLTNDPQKIVRMLNDRDIRQEVIAKLIKIGVPAIPALDGRIGSDGYNVFLVLVKIHDVRAIPGLEKILNETGIPFGRSGSEYLFEIINALDNLGWQPQNNKEKVFYYIVKKDLTSLVQMRDDAVDTLIYLLRSTSISFVREALVKIGTIATPKLNMALEMEGYVSGTDSEGYVKELLEIMSQIADPKSISTLIKFRKLNGETRGKDDLKILVKIGSPSVEKLLELINTGDEDKNLIKALGQIGDKRAREPLEQKMSTLKGIIENRKRNPSEDWRETFRYMMLYNTTSDVLHVLGSSHGDLVYDMRNLKIFADEPDGDYLKNSGLVRRRDLPSNKNSINLDFAMNTLNVNSAMLQTPKQTPDAANELFQLKSLVETIKRPQDVDVFKVEVLSTLVQSIITKYQIGIDELVMRANSSIQSLETLLAAQEIAIKKEIHSGPYERYDQHASAYNKISSILHMLRRASGDYEYKYVLVKEGEEGPKTEEWIDTLTGWSGGGESTWLVWPQYQWQKQLLPDAAMQSSKNKASLAQNGGIDLNQINVLRKGKTVNVQFDPAQLSQLEQGGFEGFTPVIINIQHISSPFQLLGINPAKQPEILAKA